MVCIYCGNPTDVTNSRHQKRQNTVWRRRHCKSCGSTITTEEAPRYDSVLMLQRTPDELEPFMRDKLLISLYKSLAHRQTAAADASALCSTVLGLLRQNAGTTAIIELEALKTATSGCLERFDSAAATHYRVYHSKS